MQQVVLEELPPDPELELPGKTPLLTAGGLMTQVRGREGEGG